jgi:general nucleoside transport system permease protein
VSVQDQGAPVVHPVRRSLPWTLRLEPRLERSRWLSPSLTLGALGLALLISAVILAIVGADPVKVYVHIVRSSLGSPGAISDTLVKATPLILTGLACAIAFRMRLWNIGAEGQLLLGAWAASAVVLAPLLPAGTPAVIVLPVMLVAGFLGGGLWGLIPGFLRSRFGVNEIIATLMLNSIAIAWIQYWVFGPWSEGGFQMSPQFPLEAWLPRLSDLSESIPLFRGLTVHAGFLVALAAAGVVWYIVERSSWGYEIRLIGDNPRAARYAGIRIARNILLVFAVSGGLAGIAGMTEVAGVVHRLQDNFSPGYGYTAIIVAYLAKFHPLRVVPVAILFGALILAGREIQPSGVPAMIQGIILFCLIASEVFLRYRVGIVRRLPAGSEQGAEAKG